MQVRRQALRGYQLGSANRYFRNGAVAFDENYAEITGRVSGLVVHQGLEPARPSRSAEPSEGLGLDLPDALARHAVDLAHVF